MSQFPIGWDGVKNVEVAETWMQESKQKMQVKMEAEKTAQSNKKIKFFTRTQLDKL